MVEFFDFGEGNIHLRMTGGFFIHNHFGQAVQCLWAEHHVHIRRTLDNCCTFLRGDAARHTNDYVWIFLFDGFDAAKIGKHFFLRFFAHGTSVKQDDVGVVRLGNLLDAAMFFSKDSEHFVAVVFVHLAAEGADIDFFHGLVLLSGVP